MVTTSFSQISSDTLTCFIQRRPDVMEKYVYPQLSPAPSEAQIRNALDNWWIVAPERQGFTLGDYLQKILACPVNSSVTVTDQGNANTGGGSSLLSNQYVTYGLVGVAALVALKMLKIV